MDAKALKATLRKAMLDFDESPTTKVWLDAVDRVFREHPLLTDPDVVEAKVGFLDALYSTNLRFARPKKDRERDPRKRTAVELVSGYIVRNCDGLTRLLKSGNHAAVKRLETVPGLSTKISSFATKFAHFQNAESFPIWDSRSDNSVFEIERIRPFSGGVYSSAEGWWYPHWVENVREIQEFMGAPDLRETDKALYWWNGGEL